MNDIDPVDDEAVENELASAAVELLCTFAVIFCLAFVLGYFIGRN